MSRVFKASFVSADKDVIDYLMYNMRSQTFAKSLPMPMVKGALKRLELLRNDSSHKDNLWKIATALQEGLKERNFNIGNTESPVTPVFFEGGVVEGTNAVIDLRENFNIFSSIVAYPVVPKGTLMLRLIPTAVHTLDDVQETLEAFSAIRQKLAKGEYKKGEMKNMFTA